MPSRKTMRAAAALEGMRLIAKKAMAIQRTIGAACNRLNRADTISAIGHAVAAYAEEFNIDLAEIEREMRAGKTVLEMMRTTP